jgi:hypothetical protein
MQAFMKEWSDEIIPDAPKATAEAKPTKSSRTCVMSVARAQKYLIPPISVIS